MKQALALALALLALVGAHAHAQTRMQALRDPFARPAAPAKAEAAIPVETGPAPRLRAIMVAPGRSLANIDGQILAVGEWFGDYRLVKVEERSVTLARQGVTRVLALDEASAK